MSSILVFLKRIFPSGFVLLVFSSLVLLATPTSSETKGLKLNEFIRHFEPADFNLDSILRQHSRVKRSSNRRTSLRDDEIKFNFTAHNRLFQIRLRDDAHNIFAPDAVFENTNGPIEFSKTGIYSGYLEDVPGTSVQGVVTSDGYFDGHVSTPTENYYIEPMHRYLKNRIKRDASSNFHSVIYKESDVDHPSAIPNFCKSHELYLHRKEEDERKSKNSSVRASAMSSLKQTLSTTYEVMDWVEPPEKIRHHYRRRASYKNKRKIDSKKTTCMLYLQADHLFFNEVGSEEAAIEIMTRHVQRVNSIYRPVDFDQDRKPDNVSFMIKRVKVHTLDALRDRKYRFPKNYGVEKFLEIFSEENYDAFCLAYMFTYRDFEGGTLGLAWTGDLKNAGGVCERNGHYRGSLKSLNTGIITLLNYGKHVPPAVSHVTMAHEMGHNFGSPHDPENNKECVPGGEAGNYIMYARATSGDKTNNRQFSPCSLKIVKDVLKAKARADKGCFEEPQEALCGNGVVEDGEECDCGWEEDCEEQCCWPQRSQYNESQKPCTLRPNKVCSPTQGPCCNSECVYTIGDKCRDDNGCRAESYCDGTSSSCPNSIVKPNKTVCNTEFVCYKGECTGSICLAYGMESCQCEQGPTDPDTKACELCCKEPGEGKPCLSSFELNDPPFDVPDMFSKPGTPCDDYKGYCDVFQKCREVDPSGPLATLRKLLLSDESIESLRVFLVRHWYTVIFLGMAVLGLMGIIVKFCGKKTPLLHRHRRRRKRITVHHDNEDGNDLSVAVDENEIRVHPEAIEPFVPIGKKVRKGENRRRRKRRSSRRKSSGRPSSKRTESAIGYAAATLAANLGRRLVVDLPLEDQEGVVDNEERDDDNQQPPRRSTRMQQPPSRNKRLSSATVFAKNKKLGNLHRAGNLRYNRKSVNPERFSLAASMTSLSKSFEKLDVVVAARRRTKQKSLMPRNEVKSKKEEDPNKDPRKKSASKEITIAKIGKFKFSLETDSSSSASPQRQREPLNKMRKFSKHFSIDDNSSKTKQRRKRDNNYVRSVSLDNSLSSPEVKEEVRASEEVIVSKKPNLDRPLSKGPKRDYRLDLNKKFTRSVSQPGISSPQSSGGMSGVPSSAPVKQRHFSFAAENSPIGLGSAKPSKRDKEEKPLLQQRSRRLGVVHKEALLLNVEENTPTTNVFDNPGFEPTSDRLSKISSSIKKQLMEHSGENSNTYEAIEDDEDSSSSSSISLSDSSKQRLSPPTQVQSLSEESSSSADLKLEDEEGEEDNRQRVKRRKSISRQRILEACIANEEAEKLRRALETAQKENPDNSSVAFIGCEQDSQNQ